MAHSKQQWEKAREYFEAGLSLTDIHDRTAISRTQISKKAKKDNWEKGNEKEQLIAQAVDVSLKKGTLKGTALEIHNELVDEKVRRKGLLFNATEKLIKRTGDLLESNKTVEKVNIGDGVQKFQKRELNASDLKNLGDTIDKASMTLNINPRHANQNINVNTQNNQIQNTELNQQIVKETLEGFENEY